MWYAILQFINIVGVVTNAFLIAFTSSWGNSYGLVGQLAIVIIFEVPLGANWTFHPFVSLPTRRLPLSRFVPGK